MSGYGGGHGGGYGGGPPSGWDPGGGHGAPPDRPPYGYGPPGVPSQTVNSGAITAAIVCNSIAIVLCGSVTAVAGVITALHAQRRATTDPRSARRLVVWSWSLFAVSVVIGIAIAALFLALAADDA